MCRHDKNPLYSSLFSLLLSSFPMLSLLETSSMVLGPLFFPCFFFYLFGIFFVVLFACHFYAGITVLVSFLSSISFYFCNCFLACINPNSMLHFGLPLMLHSDTEVQSACLLTPIAHNIEKDIYSSILFCKR